MSQAAQLPNTKLGSYSGNNALLPGRTLELDRGRGQGVRDRVPQNSRNHLASEESRIAKCWV